MQQRFADVVANYRTSCVYASGQDLDLMVDWGALQAGVIVSIIPSLGIFLLLQRYYMDGLMGGAVKN